MKKSPPLHLSVVSIEMRTFGLPLTKVSNFTYILDRNLARLVKYLYLHFETTNMINSFVPKLFLLSDRYLIHAFHEKFCRPYL